MKIIISVLIFFISKLLMSQSMDCDRFKTGTFIDSVDQLSMSVKVTRDVDYQIEEYKDGGMIIKLKITWIDECTYKLKFLEGNESWIKKFGSGDNPDLIVNIKETGKDFYIQETYFVGNKEETFTNKMVIIKE